MPKTPRPPVETAVADLTLALGQLVRRLRQNVSADGLSMSQASALARLAQGDAMTIADLARAEAIKPQSMRVALADLERQGLIERRHHPTDGRQVLMSATPEGLNAQTKRSLAKQRWMLTAVERLSDDEQRTLIDAIALIKRLGDAPADGSPAPVASADVPTGQ